MQARQVYLHGPLATTYGAAPFTFRAETVSELLSGLSVLCPGFKRELLRYSQVSIVKVRDGQLLGVRREEYGLRFGQAQELHLWADVDVAGAESFALYFGSYMSAAYVAAYVVYTVALMYVMGQIVQGLADTITTEDAKPSNASSLFNGPENKVRQGARVQLNYGRFRVGSVTLNQQMTSVRQAITKGDVLDMIVSTTGTLNVFANDVFLVTPAVTSFVVNGVTTTAGGTNSSLAGTSVTVTAAGLVTVVDTLGSVRSFDITVNATDSGVSPTQDISGTVTVNISQIQEQYWTSSGSGSAGGVDGPSPGGGDDGGGAM